MEATTTTEGAAAGDPRLPNLIIIGSQKCGTTSLHSYIARHPEVTMSTPKELDFFIDHPKYGNWRRGIEWYLEHFDPEFVIRGESSPNYTANPFLPGVAERMADLIPSAKLIFIVRDPVERVRANYVHRYANRVEYRPIEEAVLDEDSEYIQRSRYHAQLTNFMRFYPAENILVLEQDDLLHRRRPTLKSVWRFLGIRENVWRDSFQIKRLQSKRRRRKTPLGKFVSHHVPFRVWRRLRDHFPFSLPFDQPEMSEELRAKVADLVRDDTTKFRELTGRDYENWSV